MSLRDIGMELHDCLHTETVGHSICKPHGFRFKVKRHFRWNWEVLSPVVFMYVLEDLWRVDIEDSRKQEVGKTVVMDGRGHCGSGRGLQRQGELHLTASEAKGLRSWSVGSAVPVDMELI